ncbi:MAG TPA: hypothetical protein VGE68_01325 [Sphingomicrobium sp.]
MRWLPLLVLAISAPVAAQVVFAGGSWAAIDRGKSCEASARALRIAEKGKVQARAGFAFDPAGPRHGQFYAQLSRSPRAGSTVILTVGDQPFLLAATSGWAWSRGGPQDRAIIDAVRAGGAMKLESRDAAGVRFTDRYLLDGAPTAIDAAAARCAGKKAQS